jgi:hypothetical protein
MQTKAQSTIEYLATYGWAILIIAVVLVGFFYSGLFSNLQPKAPAGLCIVSRPDGPGTTKFLSFIGPCPKEPPLFVATFNPAGNNGIENSIVGNITVKGVNFMPDVSPNGRFTIAGWMYISSISSHIQTAFLYGEANSLASSASLMINQSATSTCKGAIFAYVFANSICLFSNAAPTGSWVFVAIVYNGSGITTYTGLPGTANLSVINLQTAASGDIPAHSPMIIGSNWNGTISNVQLYNNSLPKGDIQDIYIGGIGGPPIDAQWLAGWWPLNGNANDYGGNGNNGAVFNSSFGPGAWATYSNP